MYLHVAFINSQPAGSNVKVIKRQAMAKRTERRAIMNPLHSSVDLEIGVLRDRVCGGEEETEIMGEIIAFHFRGARLVRSSG